MGIVTLLPYVVAHLGYRGAVASAKAYGNAVAFQIDLDRFELYRSLHLPHPASADAERQQNKFLIRQLRGGSAHLRFVDPGSISTTQAIKSTTRFAGSNWFVTGSQLVRELDNSHVT